MQWQHCIKKNSMYCMVEEWKVVSSVHPLQRKVMTFYNNAQLYILRAMSSIPWWEEMKKKYILWRNYQTRFGDPLKHLPLLLTKPTNFNHNLCPTTRTLQTPVFRNLFSIGLNFQSTKTKKLIVEKKKFLEFTTFLTLGIEMVVKN